MDIQEKIQKLKEAGLIERLRYNSNIIDFKTKYQGTKEEYEFLRKKILDMLEKECIQNEWYIAIDEANTLNNQSKFTLIKFKEILDIITNNNTYIKMRDEINKIKNIEYIYETVAYYGDNARLEIKINHEHGGRTYAKILYRALKLHIPNIEYEKASSLYEHDTINIKTAKANKQEEKRKEKHIKNIENIFNDL